VWNPDYEVGLQRVTVPILFAWLFLPGAVDASPGVPQALILMDRAVADSAEADRLAKVIRIRTAGLYAPAMASDFEAISGVGVSCSPELISDDRLRLLAGIREGADLFYDTTAVHAATRTLDTALNDYFERPCLLAGDLAGLGRVCEGAVLLVRLLLVQDRTVEAGAVARRMGRVFPLEMVESVDAPPDAARFLHEAVLEARSVEAEVLVVGERPDRARRVQLYRDGFPVPGVSPWRIRVSRGPHEWMLRVESGPTLTRRLETSGTDGAIRFDPSLAGSVVTGPAGTLTMAPGWSGDDATGQAAERIADLTDMVVLMVRGSWASDGADGIRVTEVDSSGAAGKDLIRLKPGEEGTMEVLVASEGPLARSVPWPWPWVTGGLSAGFLAAGAYLNWAANKDASAVNRGENRVSSYKKNRTWAIVNYTMAAVGGGTALVLYFLQPGKKSQYVLGAAPVDGGAAMSFSTSF